MFDEKFTYEHYCELVKKGYMTAFSHTGFVWPQTPPNTVDDEITSEYKRKVISNMHNTAYIMSRICRYSNHTEFHYSVAHHSLLGAKLGVMLNEGFSSYHFLLHDIHECFTNFGDVFGPGKRHVPYVQQLESQIDRQVEIVWNLYPRKLASCPAIRKLDKLMLVLEVKKFFPRHYALMLKANIEPYNSLEISELIENFHLSTPINKDIAANFMHDALLFLKQRRYDKVDKVLDDFYIA